MITEIRASQLARPMVCAGFLSLDLPPQPEHEAAREGTAAGEYLERLLTKQEMPTQARNGVYFDNDMKFYTEPIAKEILSKAEKVTCEQRIDWGTRSGIKIKGSYDISFTCGDTLYIDDLKYGWGIVEPFENWQLLAYAIGEVIRLGKAFPTIVMRIHQPRPHHENGSTREWKVTYNELLEYKEKIEVRMDQLAAGLKTLTTSDKCKYCSGAAEACPAFTRLFNRALEITTEFTQDQIGEEELARQMDHAGRAQEVIKIKLDSLNQLALDRIAQGKIIPGYIAEESYGNRAWKPGVSPEVFLTLTGHKVTEEVMLSPAKVEKLGIPKEFLNELTERFFKGRKLNRKSAGVKADGVFGKGSPNAG